MSSRQTAEGPRSEEDPPSPPRLNFAGEEGRRRAAEAGRKGAEVRARKRDLTPEERALDAIKGKLSSLTNELMNAALGQGDFVDLKPETRVAALKTLMEYGLGKPTAQSKTEPTDEGDTGPTPESLFAQPRIEPAAVAEQTA